MDVKNKMVAESMSFYYGDFQALKNISLAFPENQVTALIGPSGCGKSTFLRCLNRMNDLIPKTRMSGRIMLGEMNIHDPKIDVVDLRKKIGMVFQKPNPFPKSIYENIAYAPRIHGIVRGRQETDAIVEDSLHKAGLWNEVKDRLNDLGTALSGGQQQRLCIARAIAMQPDVLLMDEPASALDPIATQKIEDLVLELKKRFTIIIVTHNMQQASRASDYTAFFYLGDLIEFDRTEQIFTKPMQKQTEDYITGRFG